MDARIWLTGEGAAPRSFALGERTTVGPDPGAVAVGEEAVWVADNGDGTVTRIEP